MLTFLRAKIGVAVTISALLFFVSVSFAHDTPLQATQKSSATKLQILPCIYFWAKTCTACAPASATQPVAILEGSSSHGGNIGPGGSPEVTYDALVRIAFGLTLKKKRIKTRKKKLAKKKSTPKEAKVLRRKKRLKKYLSLMRGVYR